MEEYKQYKRDFSKLGWMFVISMSILILLVRRLPGGAPEKHKMTVGQLLPALMLFQGGRGPVPAKLEPLADQELSASCSG